jgi:hypothetical protein
MADVPKAAVPKFTSFRPKSTFPLKDPQSEDEQNKKSKRHDHQVSRQDEEEKVHRHRHKNRGNVEKDQKHRTKKGSNREIVEIQPQKAPDPVGDYESDLFKVDRKGDIANLAYRSLHRYSVPPYRRVGYGSVLGVDSRKKIDRDLSDEKQIVLQEPGRRAGSIRRLLAKPSAKDSRQMRLIRPKPEDQLLDPEEDFIVLIPSKKRKRGSQSPGADEAVDYRSIEGKAKPSVEPADTDVEYATDSSEAAHDDEIGVESRVKNGELIRLTTEQPGNLAAWLDLVNHQVALFEGHGSSNRVLSTSEKWSLADIKVSIYEKALQKIGEDTDARSTLWVSLLKEGSTVWEAKKLASKWQEVLQAHPGSVKIWTEYLNFIQTHATGFSYEHCKAEYAKCLQILADATVKTHKDRNASSNHGQISKIFAYVYLRLTLFMQEAGYQEHAEALWQAILEIHFFAPLQLQSDSISDSDLAASFEEFWESEAPRIGELNAKGWSQFTTDSQEFLDPINTELETVADVDDIFKEFAITESNMAKKLNHPGRSADEAGEDDPYHIIFFNDIGPFLFPKTIRSLPGNHILQAFISYIGLPAPSSEANRGHDDWLLDTFLRRGPANSVSTIHFLPCRQANSDVLFTDAFDNIELNDPLWASRCLRRLVDVIPEDEGLAEFAIAFEFHFFPKTYVLNSRVFRLLLTNCRAAKTAKALIKSRRSCLRLYNCYGTVETRLDRSDSANHVFATAIGMSASLPDQQRKDVVILWRTWVWESLRSNNVPEAVRRLISIGGDPTPSAEPVSKSNASESGISSTAELRVRRWLSEGRDGTLSTGDYHLSILYSELLALLAYFKDSKSIDDALAVYSDTSSLFASRNLTSSPAHEQLHQCRTQLLTFHIDHTHIFKPSVIRDCLSASIRLFPNNTIFLSAYVRNEARFRIEDRVRSLMSDFVLREEQQSVVGWLFAISAEIQRGLEFGGTVHAVRAVFEKAVGSVSGTHSTALWKSYLLFEVSQKDLRRAKQVFFRGLRNLPWSKWFVMLAFEHLEEVLSFGELRSVWNVLSERELRVHVDIGEILEDVSASRTQIGHHAKS